MWVGAADVKKHDTGSCARMMHFQEEYAQKIRLFVEDNRDNRYCLRPGTSKEERVPKKYRYSQQ